MELIEAGDAGPDDDGVVAYTHLATDFYVGGDEHACSYNGRSEDYQHLHSVVSGTRIG
jgi:hypothetical protein